MRRIGLYLLLIVSLIGCTSQEKKKTEAPEVVTTPAPAAKPKDFERPTPPLMINDPQEKAGYIVVHFWDKFDFRDTMYCHAPEITGQAFAQFLGTFQYVPESKIHEGVRRLMDAATVDSVMFAYFCTLAERYLYNPNSPMRNDEYYIPFVEYIVASPLIPEIEKVRPRHHLSLVHKNRPGAKANNFTYTLASGRTGSLYDISAPYTLLMFINPGCTECRNTTDMLIKSSAVKAAESSGRLKVLAVYPDEDLEAWKKHANDIPPTWINSYDKPLSLTKQQLYDLKAIPTLYLLDKDKKVILKDTSVGDIHEYLERNP